MQMKLVSDYEEYYRQYIAKNPLRRAAEWERLYSEEIFLARHPLPLLYQEMKEVEEHLSPATKERLLFEALIPRVHAYVVKPWRGRRAYRGY